jgi:MOSC domain-containing protein YiiM
VCTSNRKGIPKRAVDRVTLRSGHGIEGDAHAGFDHRQVSLLSLEHIDEMRAKGLNLRSGAFGENLVIAGFDTDTLGLSSRLAVGSAELEISQIGKECHDRCAIYHTTGDCIMPRSGLFAVVVRGGEIIRGSRIEVTVAVARSGTQLPMVSGKV